jgi:hypothetical protein
MRLRPPVRAKVYDVCFWDQRTNRFRLSLKGLYQHWHRLRPPSKLNGARGIVLPSAWRKVMRWRELIATLGSDVPAGRRANMRPKLVARADEITE